MGDPSLCSRQLAGSTPTLLTARARPPTPALLLLLLPLLPPLLLLPPAPPAVSLKRSHSAAGTRLARLPAHTSDSSRSVLPGALAMRSSSTGGAPAPAAVALRAAAAAAGGGGARASGQV
jgi:hypothetical protein